MWNRRWIFAAGLVACYCVAIQVARPLTAQQNDGAGKSDKDSEREKETKQQLGVDARYADAYLRLMEATLQKYEDANRRQPDTIPASVMQVIKDGVRDARDRAQILKKADSTDAEICIVRAESELRAAMESLQRARNANGETPGNVSASQVEILKANLELAKIRIEKARHVSSESPLSNIRFELGQLREDVQQLRMHVALLGERN